MLIFNSIMDRLAVDLRLSKLPILFATFWAIISSMPSQTFVPTMSKETTIPMRLSLFSFISLFLVDVDIPSLLTSADNLSPSAIAIYSIEFEMQHVVSSYHLSTFLPAHISSFVGHDAFLISLYSSAAICISGSTVLVSLALADVKTLLFPLNNLASTMFQSFEKGLSATLIF